MNKTDEYFLRREVREALQFADELQALGERLIREGLAELELQPADIELKETDRGTH